LSGLFFDAERARMTEEKVEQKAYPLTLDGYMESGSSELPASGLFAGSQMRLTKSRQYIVEGVAE
jgi:hypothetical protein